MAGYSCKASLAAVLLLVSGALINAQGVTWSLTLYSQTALQGESFSLAGEFEPDMPSDFTIGDLAQVSTLGSVGSLVFTTSHPEEVSLVLYNQACSADPANLAAVEYFTGEYMELDAGLNSSVMGLAVLQSNPDYAFACPDEEEPPVPPEDDGDDQDELEPSEVEEEESEDDAKDAAEREADKARREAEREAEEARREAEREAEEARREAEKAAEEARKAAEKAAEEARRAAEKAAELTRKAAEKAAEEAKKAAEKAAKEAEKPAKAKGKSRKLLAAKDKTGGLPAQASPKASTTPAAANANGGVGKAGKKSPPKQPQPPVYGGF